MQAFVAVVVAAAVLAVVAESLGLDQNWPEMDLAAVVVVAGLAAAEEEVAASFPG